MEFVSSCVLGWQRDQVPEPTLIERVKPHLAKSLEFHGAMDALEFLGPEWIEADEAMPEGVEGCWRMSAVGTRS